jgi:hypothetical protein
LTKAALLLFLRDLINRRQKEFGVVFTETQSGEILSASAELDDSSVEGAFNSLKASLTDIASVIE